MNVARVAFYMHDLSGGGVERMRLVLIAELQARGIQTTLVVGARTGELVAALPPGLEIVELGSTRTSGAVRGLARFLRQACPDVLISSLHHNNIAAILAARLAGVGTRVVICQHNALSCELGLGWKYRVLPWLYWLMQSGAHGIVAVSRGVADDFAATTGLPRRRITPIYNPVIGADFAFRAALPPPHAWLAEKTCPVFVFVGRLTAQKDPQTLLDALALLRQARDARVIILGEGPLRPMLAEDAARLGITESVAFVGFQANPLPWIRHADALVCPSRYEGLGNVLIEALACDTPVIACDCPHGPYEILLGGQFGRLVPAGNALALAAAMDVQIGGVRPSPGPLRERAGAFTAKACADAHLALFHDLPPPPCRRIRALGMTISPLHARQVVDWIMRVRAAEDVLLVVTPNLHHVRLLGNKRFAAAYEMARLVCPDGFPVMAYARCCGLAIRMRVTGCELFHQLAAHPALRSQTLFLVVESAATAQAAADWARRRNLAARIHVAVVQPDFARSDTGQRALAASISRVAPTILVVTLGAPVSEIFVHEHRHMLPPCWALCVGQAVRVELGLTERAPVAWQNAGLEWLWRLRQEPKRLAGRYVQALAWFPIAILRDIAGRLAAWPSKNCHADEMTMADAATVRPIPALPPLVHFPGRTPPTPAAPWPSPAPRRSETPVEADIGS